MRVLLVGPDHEDNLSIRYLSSSLMAAGHDAELAAFNTAEDIDDVVDAAAGADMVGLSMCFQVRAREYFALADRLKDSGVPIVVVGGHYATCAADDLLAHHPAFDVIVLHEGEHTVVELAEAGDDRDAWSNIPGLAFRSGGAVVRTEKRRSITDLDSLPFPDRSGPIHLFAGVPTAYLMGSRGCVARCDYCCIVTLHRVAPGRKYRRRDPELVADEMAQLYYDRGIRQFIFHDDNFLVPSIRHNHERIDAYERALARRNMTDIGFTIKCRPPDAERSVFSRLKDLGLLRVFLGIESSSEAGLCSIGRDQTVEQSQRALELCAELDINAQYTMMMFHPDATLETVRSDVQFMRDHDDHALNFCRTEIYAGTPLEQRMIAEGRARGNYIARTYDIADRAVQRACDSAIRVFHQRCWEMGGVMERMIGMDHLDGVLARFYGGADVQRWRSNFCEARRAANRDLTELLAEVIEVAAVTDGPELDRLIDEITARERTTSDALIAQAQQLRSELDRIVLPQVGLERTGRRKLRVGKVLGALARHAAAVALAFSVAGCQKDADDHGGVNEFAAPPLEAGPNEAVTDAGPPDAGPPTDAGPADAAPPDAKPPKPDARPKKRPPIRDHPGINEFAAPPLEDETPKR